MASFEKSIPTILQHEGGFVNHPNDPGGATNYGVSLRFLADHPDLGDFDHDGDVDIDDIMNMKKEDAMKVYKVMWWNKFGYGDITDQTIATKVFDLSVNMGAKRAHTLLQQALNKAFGLKIPTTGNFGPMTLGALNAIIDGSGEQQLLDAYSEEAFGFYQRLIANRPSLKVFEKGWKNRAYSISKANQIV